MTTYAPIVAYIRKQILLKQYESHAQHYRLQ